MKYGIPSSVMARSQFWGRGPNELSICIFSIDFLRYPSYWNGTGEVRADPPSVLLLLRRRLPSPEEGRALPIEVDRRRLGPLGSLGGLGVP